MANGDDAVSAGMDVVLSTADRRLGYDEINKTRDYIARRTNAVTPIAKGGTGAATAAAARAALGITATNVLSNGAEGAAGTNASNVQQDMQFLHGLATSAGNVAADGRNRAIAAQDTANGANNNADGRVAKGGDTMTGNLSLPNSTAATASFTVCYINGDGRVSRGSSARKYKKYISDVDPLSLGDIFPQLVRYQMRTGDGDWKLGHIADDLDGDRARFAVFINDEVESIDFIQLLLAQTAQLHARLTALEDSHGHAD